MDRDQFNTFLTFAMGLAFLLGLISLLRVRARGPSAYFQAAGFLMMIFLLLTLRFEAPRAVTTVTGILVATCMALDVFFRKPPEEYPS